MERKTNAQIFRSTIVASVLAILLVAVAAGLTEFLQNVVSTRGFIFFYIAVVASAWYAGKWAGVVAVVLSTLIVAYYFMPPVHSFHVDREFVPIFVEFAGSALVIGWFSSWRKQAERQLTEARDLLQLRVEERTAELRRANEQLIAEMAERRRAEDAYYEAQVELTRMTRISAMGALAASISHEVNQPLAAVVTNADACMLWLSSDPPNLEEARLAVDSVAREGTRASDIVRRIRAMFSKGAPEQAELDINDLIAEVENLMEGEALRNQATLKTELSPGLPGMTGDRVQLRQVLVNLVFNAIEAMNSISGRPRQVLIRSSKSPSGDILVAVEDTGVGINPKDERRVFDAFFTTKGQGMGMGLAISRSIVEAHGGRLWAAANIGHGTTMQFTLPANGADA